MLKPLRGYQLYNEISLSILSCQFGKAVRTVADNVAGRDDVDVFLVNTDQWFVWYRNKQ